jgi:hypothetical protein
LDPTQFLKARFLKPGKNWRGPNRALEIRNFLIEVVTVEMGFLDHKPITT